MRYSQWRDNITLRVLHGHITNLRLQREEISNYSESAAEHSIYSLNSAATEYITAWNNKALNPKLHFLRRSKNQMFIYT